MNLKKKGLSGGVIAAIVVIILVLAGIGIALGVTMSGSDSKSGSSSSGPGGTSKKVSHTTKAPGTSTPVSTKAPGTTTQRSTQPPPSTGTPVSTTPSTTSPSFSFPPDLPATVWYASGLEPKNYKYGGWTSFVYNDSIDKACFDNWDSKNFLGKDSGSWSTDSRHGWRTGGGFGSPGETVCPGYGAPYDNAEGQAPVCAMGLYSDSETDSCGQYSSNPNEDREDSTNIGLYTQNMLNWDYPEDQEDAGESGRNPPPGVQDKVNVIIDADKSCKTVPRAAYKWSAVKKNRISATTDNKSGCPYAALPQMETSTSKYRKFYGLKGTLR